MSCLFFVARYNKKSVLTWETESFWKKCHWVPRTLSCDLWQNLRRCQGLGEPVCHIVCLKTPKSSSFTLRFPEFTWHLAVFLKAVSFFYLYAYFLHFTAIMAWPLLLFSEKTSDQGTLKIFKILHATWSFWSFLLQLYFGVAVQEWTSFQISPKANSCSESNQIPSPV